MRRWLTAVAVLAMLGGGVARMAPRRMGPEAAGSCDAPYAIMGGA